MNKDIYSKIEKLTVQDELYILGDVALNSKYAFYLPKICKAKIHLITGNHDTCFGFHLKTSKMKQREKYLEAGYSSVLAGDSISLSGHGQQVMLSHFPYRDIFIDNLDDRYLHARPTNHGLILLHGHLHCKYLKYNNNIDIGFDHKFGFYSEKEILEIIKDPRQFIPSRITDFYNEKKGGEYEDGI